MGYGLRASLTSVQTAPRIMDQLVAEPDITALCEVRSAILGKIALLMKAAVAAAAVTAASLRVQPNPLTNTAFTNHSRPVSEERRGESERMPRSERGQYSRSRSRSRRSRISEEGQVADSRSQ